MNPLLVAKPLPFGARVRLKGNHTHAGQTGTYLRDIGVNPYGFRPLVALDDDRNVQVVVLDDHQWERVEAEAVPAAAATAPPAAATAPPARTRGLRAGKGATR